MRRSELEQIVEESSARLLRSAVPPVRYWLLSDVLKMDERDPVLERTIEECRHYPPTVRLLETLQEDGTWPIPRQRKIAEDAGPGPPVGWTYTTMLRNLYELGECCTTKDDDRVMTTVERILGWQSEEGYIPGPTYPTIPSPQHNGLALRCIMRLGVNDDPRVRRIFDWLAARQRPDGGWVIPYLEDVRYLPEYRGMKVDSFIALVESGRMPRYDPAAHHHVPSCIWTTMMVMRGMVQDVNFARSANGRRGLDFFLDRFFQRNYHSAYYRSETNWTRLKYPTYHGSGLLALDILTTHGYSADDPRMEKPVAWLVGCRSKDGYWHRSERPEPVTDQWVTEIALSIIEKYAAKM